MNCQSLYLQSKWKRAQQRMLQNEQADQIKQMSSAKKINSHSHSILANKLSQKLAPFCDDSILNIETSIPLLHATQLLQAIQSIEAAKKKLQEGEFENSRLKEEARFVYCLWKMIDQEEIETRQLKEIIYMLNDKQPAQLLPSLCQIYPNQEAVSEFVETWRILLQDSQYYRSMERLEKKKQVNKQAKEIQKIMENDLKQICLNQSKQIREYFLNSSKNVGGSQKFIPILSTQLSTKNKQNSRMDRFRQQQLVNRLYQVQKYKLRQLQKKAQQQKKQQELLQSCTFKPVLYNDRLRSASANKRSNSINGYSKAVNRMKVGQQKSRIQKQKKEYKPTGENYQKLRQMKPNPPKFLQRKKEDDPILFFIEFDLGRHKVKAKIRQSDKQQVIAQNLCKIYSLKQEYFQQICLIIRKQRQVYEAQKRI